MREARGRAHEFFKEISRLKNFVPVESKTLFPVCFVVAWLWLGSTYKIMTNEMPNFNLMGFLDDISVEDVENEASEYVKSFKTNKL